MLDVVRDKAKQDYLKGMKYKEICDKYNLSLNTLRSWVQRHGWSDERKNKKCAHKQKDVHTKENGAKPIQQLVISEDAELTEKQRLFCLYYIKSFNATQAAIKAGYAHDSAHVEGSRLLRNVKVAGEIRRLKGVVQEELFIDAMDVLERYIKIAFADMTDFVDFGAKEIPILDKETGEQKYDDEGKPMVRTISYLDFKNSNQVDGGLICEISQGKQGMKIKLEDRQKALDKLAEYFDLFPDKWKRQIEEEKLKLAARKAGEDDEESDVDDGFLEALKREASEVWSDEEV